MLQWTFHFFHWQRCHVHHISKPEVNTFAAKFGFSPGGTWRSYCKATSSSPQNSAGIRWLWSMPGPTSLKVPGGGKSFPWIIDNSLLTLSNSRGFAEGTCYSSSSLSCDTQVDLARVYEVRLDNLSFRMSGNFLALKHAWIALVVCTIYWPAMDHRALTCGVGRLLSATPSGRRLFIDNFTAIGRNFRLLSSWYHLMRH